MNFAVIKVLLTRCFHLISLIRAFIRMVRIEFRSNQTEVKTPVCLFKTFNCNHKRRREKL